VDRQFYLIVTSFFPSPGNWRCAFAYDYVRAIERDGRYRVVVFKPGESYEYEGVIVHGFKAFALPSGIPCPLLTPLNVRLFLKAFDALGLKAEEVAVAEAYTNGRVPHLLALKKRNPKIIVAVHHHDPASFGVFDGRFRHFWPFKLINYWMRRRAYEAADLHIFISEVVKRSFLSFPHTDWSVYGEYARLGRGIQWLRPVRIKHSIVLHNGVDTSIFHPAKHLTNRGAKAMSRESFTIGCIGNFVDWKGQEILIRAAGYLAEQGSLCKRLRVLFVGNGPLLEDCRRLACKIEGRCCLSRTPLDFTFLPEVLHEQLSDFYRSLDLFCLPSYFEGFGCVFTEAWNCGVPFITCEGQGMDDMLSEKDRRIWLVRPLNAVDLAAKIEHYAKLQPRQELVSDTDIDILISNFLREVSSLRLPS